MKTQRGVVSALLVLGCGGNPANGNDPAGVGASSAGGGGPGGQTVASSGGSSASGGAASSGGGGASAGGAPGGSAGASGAGGALPWTCQGAGMALQFDGDQVDEVVADLMGDMPAGVASRTIEMWAYTNPKSWRMGHPLFDVGTAGGGKVLGLDFATKWENSVLVQGAYPSLNIYSDKSNDFGWWAPFTPGSPNFQETGWVHFSIRYDEVSNTYALMTNAVTVFEGEASLHGHVALRTEATPLHIGFSLDFGDAGFDGKIDEVRIWNKPRSNAEISATMHQVLRGDEDGLVGYWHFDEGVGTVSKDFSSRDHDAVMSSALKPAWVNAEGLDLKCP